MSDGLDRLRVLINSSSPIVMMETAEEASAVTMVRAVCSEQNMAIFEWTIADGLVRSGSNAPVVSEKISAHAGQTATWNSAGARSQTQTRTALSPGSGEAVRLAKAVLSSLGADGA